MPLLNLAQFENYFRDWLDKRLVQKPFGKRYNNWMLNWC